MSVDQTTVAGDLLQRFLSQANQKHLQAIAETKCFNAKDYLFHEGQTHPWLYFVLEGRVELSMTIPGRGTHRILTVGPGELVGWSAAVGEAVMTCDGRCATDVQAWQVHRADLDRLCQTDSGFGYEFMKMMAASVAKRLTATRLQLLDLFLIK